MSHPKKSLPFKPETSGFPFSKRPCYSKCSGQIAVSTPLGSFSQTPHPSLISSCSTFTMYSKPSTPLTHSHHCQRIDAFELWCWRRLLRVPWTARRANQFILKEINPEYSLEGLMLKLKLQSFGHLMRRTDSLEKTLMLGKIEGRREGDDRG